MKPNIKKYLDASQYLQDHYKFRKESEPGFSYEAWAKELRASDKSYVRLMVIGKRHINVKMTEAFAKNLNLSPDEEIYFSHLVQYTQGKTRAVRDALGKKLIGLLNSDFEQLEIQNHLDFLSDPLLPRLQVLLSFHDVDQSAEHLSRLLKVDVAELVKALDTLARLELVKVEDGRYRPAKRSFKIGDHFKDLGLERFYLNNLEASKEAISLPAETRRFKSLFLPLNEEEFVDFWKNLEAFAREQLARYNPDEYQGRRLYQAHFNIIPAATKMTVEADPYIDSAEPKAIEA